jgi:hypothetical protein
MSARSLLKAAVPMLVAAVFISCNDRSSLKEVEIRVEGMT